MTPKQWIAARTLQSSAGDVHVRLAKPLKRPTGEWQAAVEITHRRKRRLQRICGEDEFQVLLLALEFLATTSKSMKATWLGDDFGFPRMVPQVLPRQYRRRIERAIDSEIARFGRAAKARYLARRARH